MFFSVFAGTIPLNLRNVGAFDTVCTLVCKWGGQLAPLPPPPPPAPPPMCTNDLHVIRLKHFHES